MKISVVTSLHNIPILTIARQCAIPYDLMTLRISLRFAEPAMIGIKNATKMGPCRKITSWGQEMFHFTSVSSSHNRFVAGFWTSGVLI